MLAPCFRKGWRADAGPVEPSSALVSRFHFFREGCCAAAAREALVSYFGVWARFAARKLAAETSEVSRPAAFAPLSPAALPTKLWRLEGLGCTSPPMFVLCLRYFLATGLSSLRSIKTTKILS